jgi:hypothetical protein
MLKQVALEAYGEVVKDGMKRVIAEGRPPDLFEESLADYSDSYLALLAWVERQVKP